MADASWEAAAQNISKTRADLLRIIVPAPLGGTQTFWFSTNGGPDVAGATGDDVRPWLKTVTGASAKINTDLTTQRAVRTVKVMDRRDGAEDFDSTKTDIHDGGSFWQRFELAFPNYYRAQADLFSWFQADGMTSLSQAEPMFTGYMTDIIYNADDTVSIKIQDVMDFRDVSVPPPIDEAALLTADLATYDNVAVVAASYIEQFSDPVGDWESVDWMPPAIKIGSEIMVLASHTDSATLQLASNYIRKSEDIYATAEWTVSGSPDAYSGETHVGPWGRPNAQRFGNSSAAIAGYYNSSPTLLAKNQAVNWSGWVRDVDSSGLFRLRLCASNAPFETVAVTFNAPENWTRYDISTTFSSSVQASAYAQGAYLALASGTGSILVAQTQLAAGTDIQPYLYTDGECTGDATNPARGAFGTTAAAHATNAQVFEVMPYIDQADDSFGLHPIIVLRDLLNRAYVPEANIQMTDFWREVDFIGSTPEFYRLIQDTRNVSELIKEVRQQFLIDLWASESGMLRIRLPWRPLAPGDTAEALTEEADIIHRSQKWWTNKDSRVTRVFIYYTLKTIDSEPAPGDKPEDFENVHVSADLSAEGVDGEARKELVIYSRWIYRSAEALAMSGRTLGRYRLGARAGELQMRFARFVDIRTGDQVTVDTRRGFVKRESGGNTAIDYDGVFQVMELSFPRSGEPVKLSLLEISRKRYGWISPAGWPEYDAATEEERQYAYIGTYPDNYVGTNQDDGYYII